MDDHMDTGSNSGAEDGAVGGMQVWPLTQLFSVGLLQLTISINSHKHTIKIALAVLDSFFL